MKPWQLLLTLNASQLKQISRRDTLFAVFLFLALPYAFQEVLTMAAGHFVWLELLRVFLLIGFVVGVSVVANVDREEEIRYLWSLGKGTRFLFWYSFYKKIAILIGIGYVMVAGQLSDEVVGSVNRLLLVEQVAVGYLSADLLILGVNAKSVPRLLFAGTVMVVALADWEFMGVNWAILLLVLILLLIWQSWSVSSVALLNRINRMRTRSLGLLGIGFLSRYPLVKKELLLYFRMQRLLPLGILLGAGQVLVFYVGDEFPRMVFIVSMVLIAFFHEAWTLNAMGLEEREIGLYSILPSVWKRLLVTKWGVSTFLVECCGVAPYLLWALSLGFPWTEIVQNILFLTLFNLVVAGFNLQLGARYADYSKTGYYRVSGGAIWLAGFGMFFMLIGLVVLPILFFMIGTIALLLLITFIKQDRVKRYVP